MRITTLAALALLSASGAAVAQVSSTPSEQDPATNSIAPGTPIPPTTTDVPTNSTTPANTTDDAPPADNTTAPPATTPGTDTDTDTDSPMTPGESTPPQG